MSVIYSLRPVSIRSVWTRRMPSPRVKWPTIAMQLKYKQTYSVLCLTCPIHFSMLSVQWLDPQEVSLKKQLSFQKQNFSQAIYTSWRPTNVRALEAVLHMYRVAQKEISWMLMSFKSSSWFVWFLALAKK